MKYRVLLIGYGYVGSYLYHNLSRSKDIHIDVLDKNNNEEVSYIMDYRETSNNLLREYTHLLWFAGHSSVQMSKSDPYGAVDNNVIGLYNLVKKINSKTKLLIASSASVYSGLQNKYASVKDGSILSDNIYDATKKAFDIMMTSLKYDNVYLLRMGTVSGWSPKLREELIFNAMNISAIKKEHVLVYNKDCYRTILFNDHLKDIVYSWIISSNSFEKILNAGSCTKTIFNYGKIISSYHNVPLYVKGNTNTYSFRMKNNIHIKNNITIDKQISRFIYEYSK